MDSRASRGKGEGKGRTDLGVEVEDGDTLRIGEVTINFKRTLRIPDDKETYPLPPDLGSFPIRRVTDYADKVPESWRKHGGVFLPMYQREAMWLSFGGQSWRPNALKLAVGKVCAITGKPWSEELHKEPQDYVVVPSQPWLDGINSGHDTISQFIAMPLGMGYTVEGQVTGEEKHGGLQICVFEPTEGFFPEYTPSSRRTSYARYESDGVGHTSTPASAMLDYHVAEGSKPLAHRVKAGGTEMGMGAGGKMRQKIYADEHGLEAWDQTSYARVFVHLCNSAMWRDITGEAPPQSPVSAQTYATYGLPWFDLYDERRTGLDASPSLAAIRSVKEMDKAKGFGSQQDDSSVAIPPHLVHTSVPPPLAKKWHDGEW